MYYRNLFFSGLLRYCAVAGSVVDIVIGMYSYKNYLAERNDSKTNWCIKFISGSKKLSVIVPRIITFALFLSEFTFWFCLFVAWRFVVCIAIASCKLCYRTETKSKEKRSCFKRFVFLIIDALLNFFTVVKFLDYKSKIEGVKVAAYFFLYFENILFMAVWTIFTADKLVWYYWPSVVITFSCMVLHIIIEIWNKIKNKTNGVSPAPDDNNWPVDTVKPTRNKKTLK